MGKLNIPVSLPSGIKWSILAVNKQNYINVTFDKNNPDEKVSLFIHLKRTTVIWVLIKKYIQLSTLTFYMPTNYWIKMTKINFTYNKALC